MRIATYNIWNSDAGMPERIQSILTRIELVDADVLCLQEVKDGNFYEYLLHKSNYPFSCFFHHSAVKEGLAVFSKYPITESKYIPKSIITSIEFDGYLLSLANVHLSWDSALKKEKEIVEVVKAINSLKADYSFIAGDFNTSPNSSIHRFLLGQQSLLNHEANPYWYDLAEAYADLKGKFTDVTVDFRNNPRWKGENTIEVNQRFDRILLMNPYPESFPQLVCCATFGKEIDTDTGLTPSDHWGVYCDLLFEQYARYKNRTADEIKQ